MIVINVSKLSFSFGVKEIFSDVTFALNEGEHLGIIGVNGCGKSTLIKLLLGKLTPTSGYVELGYNVQIGYYDQENQNLDPKNTVLDELWNTYPNINEVVIRNTLAQFRFIGEDVFKEVRALSGGERARLTLSKLILSDINLLILDEPTNHLDIDSREALESALEEFKGTIITVSHDRYFIEKLATNILDISPDDGITKITIHNRGAAYEELCRERQARALRQANNTADTQATQDSSAPLSQKEQYLKNKQDAAEARKTQRRLERLQKEAEQLEAELDALEAEMSGEAATDYVRLAELDTKKNEIEERLLEIYEEI